jgi:H+/Cl- antiporter ClcA
MEVASTPSRLSEPLLSSNLSSIQHRPDDTLNESTFIDEALLLAEQQRQLVEINVTLINGLFGRSYACRWKFWWQHLPTAACLGAIVGCLTGSFLWSHQFVAGELFPGAARMQGFENDYTEVLSHPRHWWWPILTVVGALLASVVLELPRAPKPESFRTIIHDLSVLDGNFVESFHAVICSWIALSAGLPVGVDLLVTSLGSGCAKLIAVVFKVDPRTRGLYVQAGISAALSIILPHPLLGLLLVQELSMATRPGALTVSSAIFQQQSATRILGDETVVDMDGFIADHDIMEQVLMAGIAMASCTAIVSMIFAESCSNAMRVGSYTLPDFDTNHFVYLDWLKAVPIGLIGGALVSLSGAVYLKWNWTRVRGCAFLMKNERLPIRRSRQIFAVFAGLVVGLLGFMWSYPLLFDNSVNAWQGVLNANAYGLSALEILHFALHVIIGVTICLGCGILGGCVFPMFNAGVCVGVRISCHFFPLALAVPCCMAATVSGFVPAPFTIVLTVSMMFDLDANQSTSVLIAALASYTLTGGSGILRRLGACAWKVSVEGEDAADVSQLEGNDGVSADIEGEDDRPRADYEIRQEISSAIFGCHSNDE